VQDGVLEFGIWTHLNRTPELSYNDRMTAALEKRLTEREYLELEERSEIRHEFVDGEMVAMAGESQAHNDIAGAIYAALLPTARTKRCRIAIEGIRVRVPNGRVRYPDVFVACPPSGDRFIEENPCFIIEVLSPSTAATDRITKLDEYTSLSSLERYVLVEQDRRFVIVYRRTLEGWLYQTFQDGVLDIP
jgi:Uma2 family endonuclease